MFCALAPQKSVVNTISWWGDVPGSTSVTVVLNGASAVVMQVLSVFQLASPNGHGWSVRCMSSGVAVFVVASSAPIEYEPPALFKKTVLGDGHVGVTAESGVGWASTVEFESSPPQA